MRRFPSLTASIKRVQLLATLALALYGPSVVSGAPSLDSDQRLISVDVEPPFSTPANTETPLFPFDFFDDLVTQGGSLPCPGVPSNSSSSAEQNSTVGPLAFAGTGSASFSIEAGDCSGASADVKSVYEVTFTTDVTYDFDFEATLTNANVQVRNEASVFMSWNDHTGMVSDIQTLPPDTYTIRVDASLIESLGTGNIASNSGSFDFALDLIALPLPARNVATQDVSRADPMLHLLNLGPPNTIAHGHVDTNHMTSSVATFSDATLAGIDIVYLSPVQAGALGLTTSEIAALVAFVNRGGHLIIPADNAGAAWYDEFVALAAEFDVSYSGVSGFETSATVVDPNTPISTGPGGVVASYAVGPPHQSALIPADGDFIPVARYSTSEIALGYLPPVPPRYGHVTFLTDFNTFGDNEIVQFDGAALWKNLFSVPEPAGTTSFWVSLLLLSRWGRRRGHRILPR